MILEKWDATNLLLCYAILWMLLIGTNSNYGDLTQIILEKTRMLLEKTRMTTSCHIHQGGGGEFECFSVHLSFYKLFPLSYLQAYWLIEYIISHYHNIFLSYFLQSMLLSFFLRFFLRFLQLILLSCFLAFFFIFIFIIIIQVVFT